MPVFLHGPCICLSFFIPLFIPTRSVPGAMLDASNKQLRSTSLANSLQQSLVAYSTLPRDRILGDFFLFLIGVSIDNVIIQVLFM